MTRWTPPVWTPVSPRQIIRALAAPSDAPERLERYLCERFDASDAVATASGTQALQLALLTALGANTPGRTVALPAYGCYDLVSAAVGAGCGVVFYDVDPATLGPDAKSFEGASAASDALVVANLFGHPLDWDLVRDVSSRYDLPVIEDAAQGIGSAWRGEATGSLGDLTVLSFGRGKGWGGGGGGALLARAPLAGELPQELAAPATGSAGRSAGVTLAAWALARPGLYALPSSIPMLGLGETRYREPVRPTRISAFAAELVLETADAARREVAHRRERAARYLSESSGSRAVPIPEPTHGSSSYLRLPALVPRDAGETSVGPAKGTAVYPRILPELPQARALDRTPAEQAEGWRGASTLVRRLVTIPVHSRTG